MSALNNARKYITPECANLGPSLTTSSVILMITLAIAFILLVVAAVYAYQKVTTTTTTSGVSAVAPAADGVIVPANVNKVKGLIVASLIFVGIGTMIVIWNLIISGKTRKCLRGENIN